MGVFMLVAGLLLAADVLALVLGAKTPRVFGALRRHDGEAIFRHPLTFRTAADVTTVADQIVADMASDQPDGASAYRLTTAEPVADSSLYVLIFRAGDESGSRTVMETSVVLTPADGGTTGSVGVEAWRTVGGAVDTAALLSARSVRDRVRRAVTGLDAQAEFSESR